MIEFIFFYVVSFFMIIKNCLSLVKFILVGFYQVHMEAERKATSADTDMYGSNSQERISYKVGNKVLSYFSFLFFLWNSILLAISP